MTEFIGYGRLTRQDELTRALDGAAREAGDVPEALCIEGKSVGSSSVFWRLCPAIAAAVLAAAPAVATENYQTDIGPTAKNGRQGGNVQGRGTVQATLDKNIFTIEGRFGGLSSPATQARLHMGNVMGGTGPAIGDLKIPQAKSGTVSGTFSLTPAQVAGLKLGRLYVMLDSQSAPKGNLWGWFQPSHVTVPEGVPQIGTWYIPNLLDDQDDDPAKKNNS